MVYCLQVRLHDDKDADITAWLDAQVNKSEAVRQALRRAIAPPSQQGCDATTMRQVFEAVLDEKLAGLALKKGESEPGGEDPELAARLDGLEF